MRRRSTVAISYLLLILMLIAAVPGAQANYYDPGLPIAPIIKPVPPPPAPSEPEPKPEPKPEPSSPAKLSLSVDKTEAVVGETLTFKASMTGGKGKKSVTLWVFCDGERVDILFSNAQRRWAYVPQQPGEYYAQAIGKDEQGTIYRNSKKVQVVGLDEITLPEGGMQTMSNRPPLWIESVSDFTWLEGTKIEDIPIHVGGKPELKQVTLQVKWLSPLLYWDEEPTSKGELGYKGSIKNVARPPLSRARQKYWEGDEQKWRPATPDVHIWTGTQLETSYQVELIATAQHPEGELEVKEYLNIRYLRDSNRNGIADILEGLADNPMRLTEMPNFSVVDGQPMKPVKFRVINNPQVVWPVRYISRYWGGQNPDGLWTNSKSRSYPNDFAVLHGKIGLTWLPDETFRDFPMGAHASNDEGQKAQARYTLRVFRDDDKDGIPDDVLSVAPVPSRFAVEGEPIKPIPIIVRSSLRGPIDVEVTTAVFGDGLKIYLLGPENYNLTFKPVKGTQHIQDNPEVIQHHYELSGSIKLPKKDGFGKPGEKKTIHFFVRASQNEQYASGICTVRVLQKGKTTDKRVGYQFLPIPDVTIRDHEDIQPINLALERTVEGLSVRTSALPPGLYLDAKGGAIRGAAYIEDWRPHESSRRYSVTASALYKAKEGEAYQSYSDEMIAQEQFYITVERAAAIESGVGFSHISSQGTTNTTPMRPILITCNADNYNLADIRVSGLPEGVSLGPGRIIDGTPQITDWAEDELIRHHTVALTGKCFHKPVPNEGGRGHQLFGGFDVSSTFFFSVYREGETDENPPIPEDGESGMNGDQAQVEMMGKILGTIYESHLAEGMMEIMQTLLPDEPEQQAEEEKAPLAEEGSVPLQGGVEALPPQELVAPAKPPVAKGKTISIALYANDQEEQEVMAGILEALSQTGYRVDKDIKIIPMSAQGSDLSAADIAGKLVQNKKNSLLIAIGSPMALAIQQANDRGLPMVFVAVENPQEQGLTAAEGTGALTGVSSSVPMEQLMRMAKLVKPQTESISYLHRGAPPADLAMAAATYGMQAETALIDDAAQNAAAVGQAEALLLAQDSGYGRAVQTLLWAAEDARKPVFGASIDALKMGAAAVCVPDYRGMGRQAGTLVASILAGTDPSTLPVQEPVEHQVYYNHHVMELLGIQPPYGALLYAE